MVGKKNYNGRIFGPAFFVYICYYFRYMGCHTWYRKPLVVGESDVRRYLLGELESFRKKEWWDLESESEVPRRLAAIASMSESMGDELEYLSIDSRVAIS